MTLKTVNGGEIIFLNQKIIKIQNGILGLYTNNYTPQNTDTMANYVPSTVLGMTPTVVSGWTAASAGPVEGAKTTSPAVTFTNTSLGNGTFYGYTYQDSLGNLLFAERFATAPVVVIPGQSLTITITYTGKSEF